MTIDLMPDDPFIENLYDAPGIAVWRHDGEPGGVRYVVDVVEGHPLPDDAIIGAMRAVPDDAPFVIELS